MPTGRKVGHRLGAPRAETRCGGAALASPIKQKGTGRARAGSIRSKASVLRGGGGVIFGPNADARLRATSVTKKVQRLALKTALSSKSALTQKLQEGKLLIVLTISGSMRSRHRKFVDVMQTLKLGFHRPSIVIDASQIENLDRFRPVISPGVKMTARCGAERLRCAASYDHLLVIKKDFGRPS